MHKFLKPLFPLHYLFYLLIFVYIFFYQNKLFFSSLSVDSRFTHNFTLKYNKAILAIHDDFSLDMIDIFKLWLVWNNDISQQQQLQINV